MSEELERLEIALAERKQRDILRRKGANLEQGEFTTLPIVFEMIDSYVASTVAELMSLPALDPAIAASHAVYKAFEQFRYKFRQDIEAAIEFTREPDEKPVTAPDE